MESDNELEGQFDDQVEAQQENLEVVETPLEDKTEVIDSAEKLRKYQSQKDREVSQIQTQLQEALMEREQFKRELENLRQRTEGPKEPRYSDEYIGRANNIYAQAKQMNKEGSLSDEKLDELSFFLTDKNLPAAKLILRTARERTDKIEALAEEKAWKELHDKGLLVTETGGPSGRETTFEDKEQAFSEGRLSLSEYAKARKQKGLK